MCSTSIIVFIYTRGIKERSPMGRSLGVYTRPDRREMNDVLGSLERFRCSWTAKMNCSLAESVVSELRKNILISLVVCLLFPQIVKIIYCVCKCLSININWATSFNKEKNAYILKKIFQRVCTRTWCHNFGWICTDVWHCCYDQIVFNFFKIIWVIWITWVGQSK